MGNRWSMKRDRVDLLIQLAFVEGEITTHGLYEKVVARRKVTEHSSAPAKARLLQRLEAALLQREEKAPPFTVGGVLRRVRRRHALRSLDISSRLGIRPNMYRMLERDRLSPLKISAESWKRLLDLCQIPFDELEKLIRRAHQLVYFRASFRTTLARYDGRRSRGKRALILEHAAEELYAKAELSLPAKEQEKLTLLLEAIKKA